MKLMLAPVFRWIVLLGLLGSLTCGCTTEKPPEAAAPNATPQGPGEVKLLVVDDGEMCAAIEQLRAEWKARTGTNIAISQASSADLIAAESLAGQPDAVIYPSRLLGALAERKWIVPLPADFASNRELAWSDTFELLQIAETNWSKTPHAVPFGSPVLTCYYRPDLLESQHKKPPRSWQEYHEQAEVLNRREDLGAGAPPADQAWHGSLQPLAAGWAGRVLLARAAPYSKHRDHYSTYFEIETMEPLIAGAGFVRALEELVADAQLGPPNQIEMDAEAVRREFLAGHAAFALTWPGHAGTKQGGNEKPAPTGFAELPGSPVVYHFAHRSWEKRQNDEGWQVPLLGSAGRMGSIAAKGAEPAGAFQMLAWLAGREWGPKVSSASPATTLYRRSQIRAPQPWLDPGTDATAAQAYATGVSDAMNRSQYLVAPRIPGEAQYMEALDAAVHATLRQEKSATEALQDAAKKWQAISEALGIDEQKSAYRRSLGL
jgi:multiple sugar transport system substrate-binding protein